ncbi:MAG: hypothetical protein WCD81_05015 [Candidatus Bathyarchaeia archaeon]
MSELFRVSNPYVANMIYKFYYGKKHLISHGEAVQDLEAAILSSRTLGKFRLAA